MCTTTLDVCAFGIAPNNGPQQTPQQKCLSDFNNNLLGKTVNFLSVASPFIGPEPGNSAIEMIVGGHIKVGIISTLKGLGYSSEGLESTPLLAVGEAVGLTAEGIAEEVGGPAVAVATLSQIGVHLGCKYIAR
jgi:hypothetical protein